MDYIKFFIWQFIMQGKFEVVNVVVFEYVEYFGLSDIVNVFIVFGSCVQDYYEKWNVGLIFYEEYFCVYV